MDYNAPLNRKQQRFYGWFALAGVVLLSLTVGGLFVQTFSVFLPALTDYFNWPRADVALALSIGVMSFGLPSPIFGIIVARLGPRKAIIGGNLLACICIALLSLIQEPWHIYVLYALVGFSAGFGGYVACTTVVANWFVKRRSLALGLFSAGGGIGGFIFPPLAATLIESLGWQLAWVSLAGIVLVIGVVVGGIVLIRNRPEDMGQLPDGAPPLPYTDIEAQNAIMPAKPPSTSVVMKKLLKTPLIWLVGGFAGANAFALGTMITHQVAYLQDIGFTSLSAATTISLMSAMSFLGSITLGAVALKVNVRKLAMAGFAIELAAMIILLSTKQPSLLYVYAALLGFGNGALGTSMPTIVGTRFHGPEYSQAFGIILPFQVVAQSISAFIAGAIYDATASYTAAFYMVAAFMVIGGVFVSLIRPEKPATLQL